MGGAASHWGVDPVKSFDNKQCVLFALGLVLAIHVLWAMMGCCVGVRREYVYAKFPLIGCNYVMNWIISLVLTREYGLLSLVAGVCVMPVFTGILALTLSCTFHQATGVTERRK